MTRLAVLGVAVVLASPALPLAREQSDVLASLLAKSADYVAVFVDRFSNVVTEERFEQSILAPFGRSVVGMTNGQTRVLRSDLLIVNEAGPLNWVAFRDVFDVDNQPVRDRDERLVRLLAQPDPDARKQATRIATEGARFNLGPARTTNTPELAILFLQRSLQERFTFTLQRLDPSVGTDVWIVEYRERGRPTLVQDQNNHNLASAGRFWIEAGTGRVRQTELTLKQVGATWTLTTTFAYDDRFGVSVPATMREQYEVGAATVKGTATYGRFRSFGVTTDQRVQEAVP
jgi:hypothetical protein